jgi:RNA polymerase-binding transcription factor DksA
MKEHKRRPKTVSHAGRDQHVLRLGEEVPSAARAHEADECEVWRESGRDPWEYEDDGRRLACLEASGNRMVHTFACLELPDRAPEKIGEGTYGFSDMRDHQSPQERLEMLPDETCTLDEEQTFERPASPGRLQ